MRRFLFYICLIILSFQWAASQSNDIYRMYDIYRNPFRVFVNNISWTLTTGYAATDYKHDLAGFYFYQDAQNQFILDNDVQLGSIFEGYQNWMSNAIPGQPVIVENQFDVPYEYLPNPVNNPVLLNQQFLADADTLGLSFSSLASTIPVLASIHYDWKDFRFGFGFQYEKHFMKPLQPSVLSETIRPYEPAFKSTHYTKCFGVIGYRFYEYWNFSFVAEAQIGRAKPGPQINSSALGIGQKFFANLGVSIENNLSEYVRIIFKPSFDIKSYVINLPDASSIRHKNSAFMFQFGLSINIPEIPRSPMKSDHVQLKHVITDPASGRLMEVRGQPMWKKQNPKVGENHRRLWRYKLKNRRKIDPY